MGRAKKKNPARAALNRAAEWLRRFARPSTLGQRGERAAERYLKRHGYRIMERNFRAAGAEIDLIAMDGDTIAFIEVKTRSSDFAGSAEDAVDGRKAERMRRAARVFESRNRAGNAPMRFDVVAIRADGRRMKIDLLKDAF
ncbi:MAG TPA: YraN family protein [Candidatus Binataceae bacterium]|nr:YraN family protein [Candidatus Binataceae bacterium]